MTSAPTNPLDVPPYQLQSLISTVVEDYGGQSHVKVRCAQALGSELYIGCSNGELMRFALQADDPNKLESYSLLSRQTIATNKSIDEIVLTPSISRALVLSDSRVHFYTIPSLDAVSTIQPIRNVVTFAVDQKHLKRPAPSMSSNLRVEPVELVVVKRNALSGAMTLAMYGLRERLSYQKEIPLPGGAYLARRTGRTLCIADKEYYSVVDLETATIIPILPVNQAGDDNSLSIKPFITPISDNEFLILSWTGASTLGVFITTEGDPTRGTLTFPDHPESVCFDYPYITALLPNNTIEIHSIETQSIVQVISALPSPDRVSMMSSIGGYMVPSTERSAKMKKIPVRILRSVEVAS